MPNETKFHGILAVGRTKADAVNNYRLLAMNKGASVQVDSGHNIAFVAQASSADGMFNPMSGNMDLETDNSFIKQLEFNSNSSEQHEVNHLVCKSGCSAHIVFDSEALVKYCPNCTSSLSEDDSDEDESSDDESSDEDDEESMDEGDSSEEDEDFGDSESADEESDEEPVDEESDEEPVDEESDEEPADEESDEEPADDEASDEEPSDDKPADKADNVGKKEEPVTDDLPELSDDDGTIVISSDDADDGQLVVAASSLEEASALYTKHAPTTSLSSDGTTEVTYMLCASSECGAHILATGDVDTCPACMGSVVEPSISSDDSDEDECEDSDGDSSDTNTLSITDEDTGNVLDEDTEELDSMDDVDDSESSDIDVSYSSSIAGSARWTAYVNGLPVAMASKSSAGKNADIFDTPSFGHAVLATAKVSGVRKALKELGFSGIKHKVSVSKAVRKMVDEQVKDANLALASEQQQFKDRFMAALATAAVGLNRGFYATQKNPIKAAMWNAMSSAGIRNPEALIDTAFKNHGDAYHKTLFALASDLVAKPAEVQESLSQSIHGMSFMESTASAADSVEGRLETFGTSVSSSAVKPDHVEAPGSLGRQSISAAVASLGKHGR